MLLFCPTCSNVLTVEEGTGPSSYRFACQTCPYVYNITKKISSKKYPQLKEVDDVLGGKEAWENVDSTEGPVAHTFGDFWRTVWDQGVCVIVMVTNIVEGGRIKCLKYWPSACPEMYGPVLVSPGDEEELADYVVRKFSIQMENGQLKRRSFVGSADDTGVAMDMPSDVVCDMFHVGHP
ncbi:DNA-directed RNA polymerase III subunit RPC10 [Stylophora pistillata]|uniref:DNA-directed RNA polymerase III subunit RPC10 n=1 Tax=Stylophora pistillata TaxID=50429 RepID=A0A2B4SID3_STYPI|nr:DNA-directed RNA polymerase III subunit RPC10 [Stylophora pistillata]